jgi:hypothetical protein
MHAVLLLTPPREAAEFFDVLSGEPGSSAAGDCTRGRGVDGASRVGELELEAGERPAAGAVSTQRVRIHTLHQNASLVRQVDRWRSPFTSSLDLLLAENRDAL